MTQEPNTDPDAVEWDLPQPTGQILDTESPLPDPSDDDSPEAIAATSDHGDFHSRPSLGGDE